jgi:GMP synthase (glutamine-hydrolysing)
MRLLTIVHQDDSGPGVFLNAIEATGAQPQLWKPAEDGNSPPDPSDYDAILTFGGEAHPVQDAEYPWLLAERSFLTQALELRVPLFGVCLGSQLIAQAAGARARLASTPEIGWYELSLTPEAAGDPLFAPLASSASSAASASATAFAPTGRFDALQWHSYEVELPAGATALARDEVCLQSYRIGDRVWGIQFHAEVTGDDFQHWLDLDGSGPDAVQVGVDVAALSAQTRERIGAWNELGRGLCDRFLKVVSQL